MTATPTFLILHSEYNLAQTLILIIEEFVLKLPWNAASENIHHLGAPRNYWQCPIQAEDIDVVILEVRNTMEDGREALMVAQHLRKYSQRTHVICIHGPAEEDLRKSGVIFDGAREHLLSNDTEEPARDLSDLINRLLGTQE